MTLFSAVAAVDDSSVDDLLAEQSDLTAVERFAQRHATEDMPSQARYYRDLLPATPPQPGEQYAFEVDLDACTGCGACVSACHSLNGLDEGESWRSVKVVLGGTKLKPAPQTVSSACHHCVDPACLSGCPVDAYEKDPVTGIVSHLDDQCIGCGYCTLTCPYEVPVFNHSRGIVRKCDMCRGRLAEGEAPACVQACPNGAIRISVVATSVAVARSELGTVVPAGPPATITGPTTIYRTARGDVDAMTTGDRATAGPAKAHPSLAVMLVLTQLAVGAFGVDLVVRALADSGTSGPPRSFDALLSLAAGVLALGASVFHLGRPRYFYRAVIGLRHSWLSREVVAFGGFTATAAAYALVVAVDSPLRVLAPALAGVALASGLAGVACSVLIYTTTHRSSWRPAMVTFRFVATAAVTGAAAVQWATLAAASVRDTGAAGIGPLAGLIVAGVVTKLVVEAAVWWPSSDPERRRRARLMATDLSRVAQVRFGTLAVGGLLAPVVAGLGATWPAVAMATLVVALLVVAEVAERSLFFTTASPPQA